MTGSRSLSFSIAPWLSLFCSRSLSFSHSLVRSFPALPTYLTLPRAELEIQALMMIEAQDLHTHNGKIDQLAVKEEVCAATLTSFNLHRQNFISDAFLMQLYAAPTCGVWYALLGEPAYRMLIGAGNPIVDDQITSDSPSLPFRPTGWLSR